MRSVAASGQQGLVPDRSASCDVLVCGGGPAGIGAAVAAGRNGADVVLVEAGNALGGMATVGRLGGMIRTAGWGGGVLRDLWTRLEHLGAIRYSSGWHDNAWMDVGAYQVVALEAVLAAPARVWLHSRGAAVEVDAGRVAAVTVADKGGLRTIRPRMVVDATGDGDLAVWAGAPFEQGDDDGRAQAVSLIFRIARIDPSRLPSREDLWRASREAVDDGRLELPEHVRGLPGAWVDPDALRDGLLRCQLDVAVGIDGADPAGLADGEVLCQRRVLRIWRFLRDSVPGFDRAELFDIAPLLGVRETRRILGDYVLTAEDVLAARKFPDGIARGDFYMDLHDGQKKDPDYIRARRPPDGEFYEIPYRCLTPVGLENLLVAGRCISSSREANGSVRIQPACMQTGQAAGTAAAACAAADLRTRDLPGEQLRARLTEQGMQL